MKQKCLIASKFPGLGPPGKLDIEEFALAVDYAIEVNNAHS